jgi:hypothetical protein
LSTPTLPAMTDDNLLPFSFPADARKKVTAAFDGGGLSSGGGVMLPPMVDRRRGLANRLACCFPEHRETVAGVISARVLVVVFSD